VTKFCGKKKMGKNILLNFLSPKSDQVLQKKQKFEKHKIAQKFFRKQIGNYVFFFNLNLRNTTPIPYENNQFFRHNRGLYWENSGT
jgi:hypothetical protein